MVYVFNKIKVVITNLAVSISAILNKKRKAFYVLQLRYSLGNFEKSPKTEGYNPKVYKEWDGKKGKSKILFGMQHATNK
jgi:hypothetical protein